MSAPAPELRRAPAGPADRFAVAVPLLALFVLALGGRFTLDRLGWVEYAAVDVRLIGAAVLALVFVLWRLHPDHVHRALPLGGVTGAFTVLVGWLAVTGLWSPPGARVDQRLTDLAVLLVLGVGVAALTVAAPRTAARVLLWAGYVAGVLYAVAGLALQQTDVQGRLTAFGGGPNVFARVVGIGILAALVLAVLVRRRVLLLAVPPMVVALLLSGSRGAVVAAVGTALVFVLLFPRRCTVRGLGMVAVAVAVCVAVTLTFFGAAVSDLVGERLSTTEAGDDSGRGLLFEQAWRLLLDHPVAGAGLDAYWATDGRSLDLDYPHNLVLEIGATGGLVALALVVAFVVLALRAIRPRADLPLERIGLVLAATFMLLASMSSGDLYDSRFFWLFAIAATAGQRSSRAVSPLRERSASRLRPSTLPW